MPCREVAHLRSGHGALSALSMIDSGRLCPLTARDLRLRGRGNRCGSLTLDRHLTAEARPLIYQETLLKES